LRFERKGWEFESLRVHHRLSGQYPCEHTLITPVIALPGLPLTGAKEVLRIKQAKYAQLGKQIEMLQQAAEKLREVAPLLADVDDDDSAILTEVDEPVPAKAAASSAAPAKPAARAVTPRWP
jgi:hypothetical protein